MAREGDFPGSSKSLRGRNDEGRSDPCCLSSGRVSETAGPVWPEETLHESADDFFDGLIEGLASAERSVDFEMYCFESGALGSRVAAALAECAQRGVRVRVLVDGIGSPAWPGETGRLLESAGASVRIYHPPPWSLLARWRIVRSPGRLMEAFRNLNQRDHRKVCVIDGEAAWLGSANVSDSCLASINGKDAWHECGLRVAGPEVEVLTTIFDYAWDRVADPLARYTHRELQARRVAILRAARLVRVTSPLHIRRRNMRDLVMKIRSARRRVWIETPYFVPTPRLVLALRAAAISGADVRLVLPTRNDIFFMPWVIPVILERMALRGLRVFSFLPSTLHAKIMMIDDWATVGSSNLNRRSLQHDLEVDAVITSQQSLDGLEARFRLDFARSEEVTAVTDTARLRMHKLLGRLIMPLRHWM